MRKLLITLTMLFAVINIMAQEHLSFKGIPIEGSMTAFCQKLKAKGFTDCLCCITEKGCSVVVPKEDMKKSSPMIIKDVVYGQTGINFENITITEI